MRRAVLAHTPSNTAFDTGISWWGWRLPTAVELAIVAALTLLLFAAAVHQFSRPE